MDKIEMQPGTEIEAGAAALIKNVMLDQRLTVQAKAIYSFFILHGYETKIDMNYMADNLGMTADTLRKHRDFLEAYGYITIEKARQESARFMGNVYKIEREPKERPELIRKIQAKNGGKK